MNGLLALLACAAVVFVEQDMPGIRVGRAEPLSGARWRNFRQADLDRDGKADLILPDCVAFQRGDIFRTEDRQPLPALGDHLACDIWETTLFFRLPSQLTCVQWGPDGWQTVLEQALRWPDAASLGTSPEPAGIETPQAAHFERFLHDLDGDGTPEIMVVSERGLHVFAREGDAYAAAGEFDVLPSLSFIPSGEPQFWPPDGRRLPSPELQLSCRLFIEENRLTVLESDFLPQNQARHRIRRYAIETHEAGHWSVAPRDTQTTGFIAGDMRPCRLNGDDVIDFAGGQWQYAPGGLLHAPVYETSASTDGGQTTQFVRSISFRPHCSFVDFDGDGRLDMVTEASGLFAGGVRETVTRFMSAKSLSHDVRIHRQDHEGTFSGSPDVHGAFRLAIEEVPARSGERFRRYQAGELIDVTGDFDGDGIRDAVIHAEPREIKVYRGSLAGFGSRPIIAAETEPQWRFAVDDVDGDGRSDIVFRWMDPASADGYEQCRVFLTRERAP